MTMIIIGNYSISTEKVDATSSKLAESVAGLSIAGALTSFMMIIVLLISRMAAVGFPEFQSPLLSAVVFLLVVCIMCLGALFFAVIFGKHGCGIRVFFDQGSTRIDFTDHAFTTDPMKDAEEVQKIIDGYTKRANALMDETTKKDESESKKRAKERTENEKCCAQYKEVMKLVEEKQ